MILERSGRIPWEATHSISTALLANTCTPLKNRASYFTVIHAKESRRGNVWRPGIALNYLPKFFVSWLRHSRLRPETLQAGI